MLKISENLHMSWKFSKGGAPKSLEGEGGVRSKYVTIYGRIPHFNFLPTQFTHPLHAKDLYTYRGGSSVYGLLHRQSTHSLASYELGSLM